MMGSRAHLAGTAGKSCVALPGHGLGQERSCPRNLVEKFGLVLLGAEAQKQAWWQRPDPKGHILFDSIYMKCPEKVNRQRPRAHCW